MIHILMEIKKIYAEVFRLRTRFYTSVCKASCSVRLAFVLLHLLILLHQYIWSAMCECHRLYISSTLFSAFLNRIFSSINYEWTFLKIFKAIEILWLPQWQPSLYCIMVANWKQPVENAFHRSWNEQLSRIAPEGIPHIRFRCKNDFSYNH